MAGMPAEPYLAAEMAAAASLDWAARVRAARQLATAADQTGIAQVLLALLLDPGDTAVTDAACLALLGRADIHATRLVARAVALADGEQLDHLYGAIAGYLLPDGPVHQFRALCRDLSRDPDPVIQDGTRSLISWTGPWEATEQP